MRGAKYKNSIFCFVDFDRLVVSDSSDETFVNEGEEHIDPAPQPDEPQSDDDAVNLEKLLSAGENCSNTNRAQYNQLSLSHYTIDDAIPEDQSNSSNQTR